VAVDRLAVDLGVAPALQDGLAAWLDFGVDLGILAASREGYTLRRLARQLVNPAGDAAAAFLEEAAALHHRLISEAPERWREGRPFTLADQDGPLVARSSRMLEPYVGEAVDAVVPTDRPCRLLEIGCGSGVYIRRAAIRNPALTALGLELQPEVAAVASENLARWGLAERAQVEAGDVRQRAPVASFDLVTLHNNINYFPPSERVAVLRHVGSFLVDGGQLLVTISCRGPGGAGAVLDLWGAMTAGCGRLPTPAELTSQLAAARFSRVGSRSLIPGQRFYAFIGVRR